MTEFNCGKEGAVRNTYASPQAASQLQEPRLQRLRLLITGPGVTLAMEGEHGTTFSRMGDLTLSFFRSIVNSSLFFDQIHIDCYIDHTSTTDFSGQVLLGSNFQATNYGIPGF